MNEGEPFEARVGGRLSGTLTDGTVFHDSPITERSGGLFICNGLVPLRSVKTSTSYTPPRPSWDDGSTVLVKDRGHSLWVSDPSGWTRLYGQETLSAGELEQQHGPCTVVGVAP